MLKALKTWAASEVPETDPARRLRTVHTPSRALWKSMPHRSTCNGFLVGTGPDQSGCKRGDKFMPHWSVQDAKAQLSELMRRARAGEPQRIGTAEPCVVVGEAQWLQCQPQTALGAWLVESAPRGEPLELPSRLSSRPDPFL